MIGFHEEFNDIIVLDSFNFRWNLRFMAHINYLLSRSSNSNSNNKSENKEAVVTWFLPTFGDEIQTIVSFFSGYPGYHTFTDTVKFQKF